MKLEISKAILRLMGFYITLFICSSCLPSCSKMVEVDPPSTKLVANTVFENDATANSAVVGIYLNMIQSIGINIFPAGALSVFGGVLSDELKYLGSNSTYGEMANNSITTNNSSVQSFWNQAYKNIYAANSIIEGLEKSSGVTPSLKTQLLGEAKFIRAFCHFYLVNYFGDIPVIASTDYKINANVERDSKADVYSQMIVDLKDAQSNLAADYSYSNNEKLRPNKWSATALLARVYLYFGDWSNAEEQATDVINNGQYDLVALNSVFSRNNNEAIWQLGAVPAPYYGTNIQDAVYFIPSSNTRLPNATITTSLLQGFELNDGRKTSWLGTSVVSGNTYYYPFKYKVKAGQSNTSEYYTILRLAEQFLIRAEAEAHRDNLTGCIDDLNKIRIRANLPPLLNTLTQAQCLSAIIQERRIELMFELGHRWLDLKRTGIIDGVMSAVKTAWSPTAALFPIPQSERLNNLNLSQNSGY